ncbi:sodium:solute symporter family protein [Euzebyella saccharophila]|uniref:Sodium:solute symporter family protein n=1 Tax=Euzebyella saccharophila TaxID=679664 RepID=A0ABV8JSB2_9FLAO|nr:sodium:solute symporter family protein [Euzebyella saccharophila]
MTLHFIDIAIVATYVIGVLLLGFYLSRKASKNLESYFLGGNQLPWYYLGLSNASGMFDISGTMWTVGILFVYGLKSAWLPWLWPVWNQVFVFVYLAIWMRRSNVMTGAEWITFRFGDGRGAKLSHIIIVVFAVISVLGFIAYFFEGIGKYSTTILPWDLGFEVLGFEVDSAKSYALIICGLTSLYTIKGGMHSVVATEVMQFVVMTIACIGVGVVAYHTVDVTSLTQIVPAGWKNLFFGWNLGLDWSGTPFPQVDSKIAQDGFDLFGLLFVLMVLKGILASTAGPVPSYDMQRILATKTPAEAAKMSFLTICVLYLPRYFMIIGFAVLALVHMGPEITAMGDVIDFEQVLPMAINKFLPVGLKGLMLAGFLAAFMGTFAAFVNSAPAYIVNDIYKKYINPKATDKRLVQYSILSSLLLVVVGIVFGFNAGSLNQLILWLSSALYGGYVAANVLKWIWWRFTGMGYFWGMLFGLIASTIKLFFFPEYVDIFVFPVILLFSMLGCIIGTYLQPLPNREQVKEFYKKTKPWGFWKPIREEILAVNPDFIPNKNFKRDSFNVMVGVVWQMAQVVIPIYFMLRENTEMIIWCAILILTSALLKKYWWNNLKNL